MYGMIIFEIFEKFYINIFQTFNFDISTLDWTNYFDNYCLGMRKFILKEDEKTLPQSRDRLKRYF